METRENKKEAQSESCSLELALDTTMSFIGKGRPGVGAEIWPFAELAGIKDCEVFIDWEVWDYLIVSGPKKFWAQRLFAVCDFLAGIKYRTDGTQTFYAVIPDARGESFVVALRAYKGATLAGDDTISIGNPFNHD